MENTFCPSPGSLADARCTAEEVQVRMKVDIKVRNLTQYQKQHTEGTFRQWIHEENKNVNMR